MVNLKWLLESGLAYVARMPMMNDYLLDKSSGNLLLERLETIEGYTVPMAAHDYTAKTPVMWNMVYEKIGVPIRNIMIVTEKVNLPKVMETFRNDPKYLGGGVGVGLKESVINYLDRTVPTGLRSVNCIVKRGNELVGHNTDSMGFVKSLEDRLSEFGKTIKGATIVGFGAGGVAQEVYRLLASKGASYIVIVNRTRAKAVALAYELGQQYPETEVIGVGEDLIRGVALNTIKQPDAFVNLTDKGTDGPLVKDTCFAPSGETNVSFALSNVFHPLQKQFPDVIIADITLPKGAWPATLHWAEYAGFPRKNLLNGIPMVINQAAPAYMIIQDAFPELHDPSLAEPDVLWIMTEASNMK